MTKRQGSAAGGLILLATLTSLAVVVPTLKANSQLAQKLLIDAPGVPAQPLRGLSGPSMRFEPNHGQTDPRVKFMARFGMSTIFLTPTEAVLALREKGSNWKESLRMTLVGANPVSNIRGTDQQGAVSSYFNGQDPSKWQTGVPNYGKVKYEQVYPNIDLVYHSDKGSLEYDFIVSPNADPNQIKLSFEGAKSLKLDTRGNLNIRMENASVTQRRPISYQTRNGTKTKVQSQFKIRGNQVTFKLGAYDPTLPLTIDPLVYSTYLGTSSSQENSRNLEVDSFGNAFVVGETDSASFPTTPGVFQATNGGGFSDIVVTKFNPSGNGLLYSTYIGGADSDRVLDIEADLLGNAFVVGITRSNNFPTTAGAFQASQPIATTGGDGFITKLDATGTGLLYSTYLGGTTTDGAIGARDEVHAVAVDSGGNAYVTGATKDSFPTTLGAFDTTYGDPTNHAAADAFVAKLNASGSALIYSTLLGGDDSTTAFDYGDGIAFDSSGNAIVSGATAAGNFPTVVGAVQTTNGGAFDAFVTKLNTTGTALMASTYLGGSGSEGLEQTTLLTEADGVTGFGMVVDGSDNVYVTGTTNSSNFPTTAGALQTSLAGNFDVYITKLNSTFSTMTYSTFLGGSLNDHPQSDRFRGASLVLDDDGNAYVSGSTQSADFPMSSPFQGIKSANGDRFAAKLNSSGAGLVWSTYLGAPGNDSQPRIGIDASRNVYLLGVTSNSTFVTTPGAYDTTHNGSVDYVLTKLTAAAKERLADFNAQGTTDLSVYRGGTWYINDQNPSPKPAGVTAYSWGGDPTDKIVPGDYNGDGHTDTAVYRGGTWYINYQQGLPSDINIYSWGGDSSDVPAPGDYDGDGDTDLAVYRAATGTWYVNRLEGGPGDITQDQWGGDPSDKAVPGDYDKDGDADFAVYRTATGYWYVQGQPALESQWGGDTSDKAVPGDYDGDGDTDVAVYRTATGYWYVKGQPTLESQWGGDGSDLPVPADYNRDGKTDLAVYRKATGYWYVKGQFEKSWGGDTNDVPASLPTALR